VPLRWRGRWLQERLQFTPDEAEGIVVLEQHGVHLGEPLEHIRLGQHDLALLDEGTHNVDAHFDGVRAVEDIGRHQRAVLGEGKGQVFAVPSSASL
jgi:hypothetical protein